VIVGGDLEEELPKPIGGASNEYVQARKDVLRSVLTRTLQTERQHVFVKIYWCIHSLLTDINCILYCSYTHNNAPEIT